MGEVIPFIGLASEMSNQVGTPGSTEKRNSITQYDHVLHKSAGGHKKLKSKCGRSRDFSHELIVNTIHISMGALLSQTAFVLS